MSNEVKRKGHLIGILFCLALYWRAKEYYGATSEVTQSSQAFIANDAVDGIDRSLSWYFVADEGRAPLL